jgi:ferrous iron transport protein B
VQMLEMGTNLVIALNMMDVAESRGYQINVEELSRLLGTPVIPVVATRNLGTQELLQTISDVAEGNIQIDGIHIQYGHDVEEEVAKLERLIADNSLAKKYPSRWLTIKLLEEDEEIISKIRQAEVGQ